MYKKMVLPDCIILSNISYQSDFIFIPNFIDKNKISIEITRVDGTTRWDSFQIKILNKLKTEQTEVTICSSENVQANQIVELPFLVSILETKSQKIQKIVHQTWETWDDIQGPILNIVNTWKQLNPDYEYKFYNKDQRREYIEKYFDSHILQAYDNILPGSFKADLFRYCVLYNEGGIYADIKIRCYNSLAHVISPMSSALLIRDRPPHGVLIGLIGFEKQHTLLKLVIDRCVYNIHNKCYGLNAIDITGPQMFGRCFNIFCKEDENNGDIKNIKNIPEDINVLPLNGMCEPIYNSHPIAHLNNKVYRTTFVNDIKQRYTTMWMERRVFL